MKEADKEVTEQDHLFQFLFYDMRDRQGGDYVFKKSTWGDQDFTCTFEAHWNHIAPKCPHSIGENLVQTAKFVGKTYIDEASRLMMTSMWIDRTLDGIDLEKESIGPAKMKAIIAGVKSKSRASNSNWCQEQIQSQQ